MTMNDTAKTWKMLNRCLTVMIVTTAVAGCGGGSDSSEPTTGAPLGTAPAPAPGPAPDLGSAPTGARVLYFSDCQSGAASGCLPGSNGNAGTSASAPKQDLSGIDLDALPAGSRLLFARGGVWSNFRVSLRNLNATPSNPIVFDSYAASWGGTAQPWLMNGGGIAFNFGAFNDTVADGGYTIRNLKLDGRGIAGSWGVFLSNETRNVTLENLDISGFFIGVHSQNNGATGNTALVVRNSNIHNNSEHGILGDATDLVIEGNTIADNNMDGGPREHGIYLGGHGRNGVIRNNTFSNNSAPGGVCSGGNLTVHGQWDGLLIEGNTIQQAASTGGCYGISITPGYDLPEFFRNVVIRGNTITNLGGCAVCAGAAPGILVEGNRIFNSQATYQTGVVLGANVDGGGSRPAPGDAADAGGVVRNNIVCFTQPAGGSSAVAAFGGLATGNVYLTGAAAAAGVCAR